MKTKHIILAAILAASTALQTAVAENKLPAPKPEFKTQEQLTKWSEEKTKEAAAADSASAIRDSQFFFTGRPFDTSSTSYLFKYRSYDPGLLRWTSNDPSGFPDGVNNQIYAPVPTSDFDYQGLLKWSSLKQSLNPDLSAVTQAWSHGGNNLTSEVWTVQTNDSSATITLWNNTTGGGIGDDYRFNCHGFTFGNSLYWINAQIDAILSGDGYTLITSADKTGARIAYWGNDVHSAKDLTVDGAGTVTSVTGKLGSQGMLTSTPVGQGYGTAQYYE